ncbi:nuclear transport factor 2 family protein [Parerythrobacter aurantius]|uniref:nuclear transport factor 2 family protein n=1 Tax=Parerythrobacter aurantius TaxID=3127706 RepID=UPI0032530842
MANLDVLEAAFDGTAKGDGRAFVAMMSDNVRWHIIGSTSWSRSFEGKASVVNDLLRPLAAQFDGPNIVTASRYIGDGPVIAVEGQNHSLTKEGERYPNRYCWVFTFEGGNVVDIVEYCDTALIERVLSPLKNI